MEQRNEPTTAELIKNARYCCGDVECEGEKDCGDYCLDGRDERNGDLRWCRQWLVHDLADRLEQLERDLETFKAFHERYAQQTSKKYVEDICELTARAEKAEADRDAAVAEIKESYAFSTGEDGEPIYDFALCLICDKKDKPECDCTSSVGSEFVWRGLRGKGNA